MNAMRGFEAGWPTTQEELALRRRLLFRLLQGFSFEAPQFHGEMITPPALPGQRGQYWR